MNIKHTLISRLIMIFFIVGISNKGYGQIDWSNKPTVHVLPDSLKNESAVLILDNRVKEIQSNPKKEEVYLVEKEHKIIKINDALGLESYNKFVLADGNDYEIFNIKARTIKANGKVYDIKDFKTTNNEYGGKQYHVAFENLSIGDDIEMLIESKRPINFFGKEEYQRKIPVLKAIFTFITPSKLEYEVKSYNGFANATTSEANGLKTYQAVQYNIPGLQDEIYADPEIHKQRIEYKLSYTPNAVSRLYTWNDFAKVINQIFYTRNSGEEKAVKKFVSDIKIDASASLSQQIIQLESYIKTNIVINENLGDEYAILTRALEKKTTSKKGITKLFVACLDALNIKHELGVTTNKFEALIDEQFENWNPLEHYVIYISDDKKYLIPAFDNLRYPAVTPMLEDVKVIFSKRLTHGEVTTAVSVFRTMPISTYEENFHDIYAHVRFDEEFVMDLDITHSLNGLSAVGYREMITFLPAKDEKAFLMNILDVPELEDQIISYTFKNKGLEHYSTKQPIEIQAKLKLENLVEKAGNKYLVQIGKLIGPQQEMYKVEKRHLPISIPSTHVLNRELIVEIPKGYKVVNPEAVVINKDFGKDKYGFISSYKIEGDKLIINLQEYYAKLIYDKSLIEEFRSVINAAADFNKVTLVFEKI